MEYATTAARHPGLAAICVVVGNLSENLGVATGFPFGRYYFVELMGPKLFHVPVLLGLAYIGMAYVSWTLARLIAGILCAGAGIRAGAAAGGQLRYGRLGPGAGPGLGHGPARLGLARRRALVRRAHLQLSRLVWNRLVIYLLFALYLRAAGPSQRTLRHGLRPRCSFMRFCARATCLQDASGPPAVVQDPTGKQWRVTPTSPMPRPWFQSS
jgi:hypothetical protein